MRPPDLQHTGSVGHWPNHSKLSVVREGEDHYDDQTATGVNGGKPGDGLSVPTLMLPPPSGEPIPAPDHSSPEAKGDKLLASLGFFGAMAVRTITVPKEVWEQHSSKSAQAEASKRSKRAKKADRKSIFGLPVLHPYSNVCLIWFCFMLLFDLIFTAFWVPISVGFCSTGDRHLDDGCSKADIFGGVVYTLNFIFSFQFGAVLVFDLQRKPLQDGMQIAWYYIRYGRFIVDLLAIMPFFYLVVVLGGRLQTTMASDWIYVVSLVRLLRLLRLASISRIVYADAQSDTNMEAGEKRRLRLSVSTTYIIMLVYVLTVIVNLEACIALLIASIHGLERSWMQSLEWVTIYEEDRPYQWYAGVYWVITTATTTGYGDIIPYSRAEQVFANVVMVLGMCFFGLLVGTVSNALTRADESAQRLYKFRKKITNVKNWLDVHDVPQAVRQQVQNYFADVWANRVEVSLDSEIFADLPHYLRQELAAHVNSSLVASMRVFQSQDPSCAQVLAMKLRPVDVVPGQDLCQQGEDGDRMWIIREGEALALQHLQEPLQLPTPCLVGDSAAVLSDIIPTFRARPFTIRVLGVAKVWELRVGELVPVLRMYPDLRNDMLEHVRRRCVEELTKPEHERSDGDNLARTSTLHTKTSGTDLEPDRSVVKRSGTHGTTAGWDFCEASASIVRTLQQQSTEVQEEAVAELNKAQNDLGMLCLLLDGLMEFSTVRKKKPININSSLAQQLSRVSASFPSSIMSPNGGLLSPHHGLQPQSTAPPGLGFGALSSTSRRGTGAGAGLEAVLGTRAGAMSWSESNRPGLPTAGPGTGLPATRIPNYSAGQTEEGGSGGHGRTESHWGSHAGSGAGSLAAAPSGDALIEAAVSQVMAPRAPAQPPPPAPLQPRSTGPAGVGGAPGDAGAGGPTPAAVAAAVAALTGASGVGTGAGVIASGTPLDTHACPHCGRYVCRSCGQVVTPAGTSATELAAGPGARADGAGGGGAPGPGGAHQSHLLRQLGVQGRMIGLRGTLNRASSVGGAGPLPPNRSLNHDSVPFQEFGMGISPLG